VLHRALGGGCTQGVTQSGRGRSAYVRVRVRVRVRVILGLGLGLGGSAYVCCAARLPGARTRSYSSPSAVK
jgi:hypothetical protein